MLDAARLELFLALSLGGAVWLGWILRGVWERLALPPEKPVPQAAEHATPPDATEARNDMPDDKPADPR